MPRASAFNSVVLDGDGALTTAFGDVWRVAPCRPAQVVVASHDLGDGSISHIAADADHIYGVVAGGRRTVFAAPRSGGKPVDLAREIDDTGAVVVAGSEVLYFTSSGGSGGRAAINAVPTTGGPSRVVTLGTCANRDLTVAGDRILFSADGRVWSAPR